MNLYVNDLEKRFNNLNNKDEKFDELTNVQTTQINELEQIVEKLTQLNKERETVIKDQQQNIDILEKSINNYRIEQIYYEQWKETIDKKADNPILDEKSLKGYVPIMEVYNKEPNKKSKKRKRMEIIPKIVKKFVKKK